MKKIIFLFCLMLLPNSIFAQQQSIGVISAVEGVADISHDGQDAVMLSEKQEVYLKDRIRTKNYSKVEVILNDKSVVKLAASSCVSFEELKLLKDNVREFCRLNLTRGKIETIVSKTGKPDTFVIDTPNASGSVKGSDIFISYLAGRTGFFVQEGGIAVMNPTLADSKMIIAKGNCAFVPFDKPPSDLRPTMDAEMLVHKKDVEKSLIKKWIPSAGAAKMICNVVSSSGTVRIFKKNAEDWSVVQTNQLVDEGDKLQTGSDGRVEVKLSNGNVLVLQANTELAFTKMRYDEKSGDFENTFDMAVGEVLGVVEKINKKSTFQLRTPTAVSGVRGTFIKVLVAPPTVNVPKPQTQVFFEGGNGIVTSVMTGQSKEVFAGQNVLIDNVGQIAPPVITSSEQRTTMVHTWTMGQTVNNYSTAKGFSGPGGQMKNEKMPPPPMQKPMMMFPPPINQNLQNTDLTSTVTRPVENVIFYRAPLVANYMAPNPTPAVITANMDFSMKDNGTFHGIINGHYTAAVAPNWSLKLINGVSDDIRIIGIKEPMNMVSSGPIGTTPITNFVGVIQGTPIDKNLHLNNFVGNYNSGNFVAEIYGTWTDVPPGVSGPILSE